MPDQRTITTKIDIILKEDLKILGMIMLISNFWSTRESFRFAAILALELHSSWQGRRIRTAQHNKVLFLKTLINIAIHS
ncbi:MAG: hypothetical protein PHD93_00630 [Candidatus Pacebacteria bacterium]|nr:hypothetical protein [Candidatus Paceibacterota bacterium]